MIINRSKLRTNVLGLAVLLLYGAFFAALQRWGTEEVPFRERNTIRQLKEGIEPAQTVMGKLGFKTMKELGLTPKSCTAEVVRGKLCITISTKQDENERTYFYWE